MKVKVESFQHDKQEVCLPLVARVGITTVAASVSN